MAARAAFSGFESYELTGVKVTDKEFGHGSYATVLELDYAGLKCAGKKLHELLVRQGNTSYTVRRFKEECRLLSQIRHPNIVQFLGIHFCLGDQIPILVMEFLPTNLTSCIEQYGILPKEISYSILHEVALGLNYLHSQTPPIIHRDLSSNNVLLTSSMTAKISDLGVARILNLTPGHFTHMTQTPGTPAYMPPEVMVANPKYDTSVDEFSYGVLMIHVLSGKWPEPQVGQVKLEEGKLVPVSEAQRREVFLQAIGNDHPLMDLIRKCINNDPNRRVPARKIVEIIAPLSVQVSTTFDQSRLEMLKRAQFRDEKIRSLSEEVEQKTREVERLNLIHASEIETLQLQEKNFDLDGTLPREEKAAEVEELKANVVLYEAQIEHIESTLKQLKIQQTKEREEFDIQLSNERQTSQKLSAENLDLRSEVIKFKVAVNSAQSKISSLEADNALKDFALSQKDASLKRNAAEISAKSKVIQSKDAIISQMQEQLTKMREYLTTSRQVYIIMSCQ